MSPSLASLVEGLDARIVGDGAVAIGDIAYDSRRVAPGALFCALRGAQTDGHRFVADAVAAGAPALLLEELPDSVPVAAAIVPDTRSALADVASRFFDHPGRQLEVIGVTGTNGKTSTVRMIEAVLLAGGRRAGSIGTISIRYGGTEEMATLTTPESVDLQRTLAHMRDAGAECVALEVSSHSLSLGRVRTLRFAVAVYTQLSQDHLDFHADLGAYADAKAKLFSAEYLTGTAVLNSADPLAPRLADDARAAGCALLTYGRGADAEADLRTTDEHIDLDGARFTVESPAGRQEFVLPLPGDFQVENALGAIGTGLALGVPLPAMAEGLAQCPPVPGRLERVGTGTPSVFVDYAHTPDALDRVLARVRPFVAGRLICVFGCGGDRDSTKRAPMARAACKHADLAIATSDNPRTEDPDAILADVAKGLSENAEIVSDRRAAIRRAIASAAKGDVVLIAGKGHEDYQIVGTERRPFDDRDEARAALELRS